MMAREITAALGGRWFGEKGSARCPAHKDRSPSLSIRDGRNGVLLYCHAGCQFRDIAAELRSRGLLEPHAARKHKHAVIIHANPLSDKALKLGRYAEPETKATRHRRIERACRVDMILDGVSADTIKGFSYGR